jgi:hypothetical protein
MIPSFADVMRFCMSRESVSGLKHNIHGLGNWIHPSAERHFDP